MKHPVPVLFVVFVTITLLFSYCSGKQNPPRASQGKLILKEWDFAADGPVDLDGEYEFYWQKHIPPETLSDITSDIDKNYVTVPRAWNNYVIDNHDIPGEGYATFRLLIELKEQAPVELALKFLDMGTAFLAFANGDTLLSMGEPGIDKRPQVPAIYLRLSWSPLTETKSSWFSTSQIFIISGVGSGRQSGLDLRSSSSVKEREELLWT